MNRSDRIWLIESYSVFNKQKKRIELYPLMSEYSLRKSGKYLPTDPGSTTDKVNAYNQKWNIHGFTKVMNTCLVDNDRVPISYFDDECDRIADALKNEIARTHLPIQAVYIQREPTKNIASFTPDEIKSRFRKLI